MFTRAQVTHVLKTAARQLPNYVGHAQQQGHCFSGTHGTPRGPRVRVVGLLKVEPTFLARASVATQQHADMEMRKLARRARGLQGLFHVCWVHGVELVFRGTG